MSEFLANANLTWFDLIVAALMVLSGFMAFARGFIRELASVLAFAFAIVASFLALIYLGPRVHELFPESWSVMISSGLVVLVTFLVVYIFAAWFGRKFSRFVHATTDISFIDRIAGLIFGLARAAFVVVLILFVFRPVIEEAQLAWVLDAFSYPYFEDAVNWLQGMIPVVAEEIDSVVPDELTESL